MSFSGSGLKILIILVVLSVSFAMQAEHRFRDSWQSDPKGNTQTRVYPWSLFNMTKKIPVRCKIEKRKIEGKGEGKRGLVLEKSLKIWILRKGKAKTGAQEKEKGIKV